MAKSNDKRFFTAYLQSHIVPSTKIIVDKVTGVQYLVYEGYQRGGMTVLVDQNGKPLLYRSQHNPEKD